MDLLAVQRKEDFEDEEQAILNEIVEQVIDNTPDN